VEPDGPRGVLRTVWFVGRRFPPGTRLSFELTLRNGEVRSVADLACVWWYPPERWQSGEVLTLDVPDVPVHDFLSWRAVLSGI
jgi:hypothetical protein